MSRGRHASRQNMSALLRLIAHRPVLSTAAVGCLMVLFTIVGSGLAGALALGAYLVAAALLSWSFLAHLHGTCLRCVDEVPEDGPAQLQRHRRALAIAHASERHPWLLVAGLVIYAVLAMVYSWTPWVSLLSFSLPALAAMAVVAHGHRQHIRLLPWCPRCTQPADHHQTASH